MVEHLVIVNGLPGSGKTTLATALAAHLDVPLVSKDAIKEALTAAVPQVPFATIGGIAMDTAWRLAAATPGTVILESWWFRPRDLTFAQRGLDLCQPSAVIEIWCEVPADLARARYEKRRRHPVHDDAGHLTAYWDQWAAHAEPLGVGHTLRVPTDRPIDIPALAVEVHQRGIAPTAVR